MAAGDPESLRRDVYAALKETIHKALSEEEIRRVKFDDAMLSFSAPPEVQEKIMVWLSPPPNH